jgi:methyl-accepting chemotaxis protein
MRSNSTLRAKLYFITGLALAGFLVLAGVGYHGIQQGTAALKHVYEDKVQLLSELGEMDAQLKEVRFRMVAVLVDQMPYVGSNEHLKQVRQSLPELWERFKRKANIAAAPAEQRQLFEKIDRHMARLPGFLDKLGHAYEAEDKKTVTALLEDEWPSFQGGLVKPLSQILPAYQSEVKSTYEASAAAGRNSGLILGFTLLFGAVSFLVVMAVVAKALQSSTQSMIETLSAIAQCDLTARTGIESRDEFGRMSRHLDQALAALGDALRNVEKTVQQVVETAAAQTALTGQMQQRSKERAADIAAISAAIEEISASIQAVADQAGEAEAIAEASRQSALEGKSAAEDSSKAIGLISDSVRNSATLIENLHERSSQISGIVHTIKEIADQTNLLALNAAIEAARAGEQGRGFAVVADEVRKLAERTANATTEITSLIDTVQKGIGDAVSNMEATSRQAEDGVAKAGRAAEMLSRINDNASRISGQTRDIAAAMREQSSATDDIARKIERISASSGENQVAMNRIADAAGNLRALSESLNTEVRAFKVA